MKTVLVVAPHADDETLGCGGTLLKLKAEGCELHWLLVTEMTVDGGFSSARPNSSDPREFAHAAPSPIL
jgi:LmbE family N-acetylglucosaminyl deacetylase